MKRRTFLAASSTVLLTPHLSFAAASKRRVAVIGHSGRGNYGHGLDTVWQQIPETEIVGVADGNQVGLATELIKLKTTKGFSDYREMLEQTKPEFVTVAPRHADQHHDMILAAIESGVKGIYCEKPFVRTPAEADSLIAAAKKHGTKIAVAHRNRYHPALPQIDQLIASGEMGKLLEIRGKGKGDRRGGGEDLWVLGTHIVNLFTYFAGAPKSCSAIMLQDGKPVTAADVKPGAEGLGPLAANELHARYVMQGGPIAYYDSVANDGTAGNGYCFQLIGSKGVVTWHIDRDPVAHFAPGNPWDPALPPRKWLPITSAGVGKEETQPEVIKQVHNHVLAVRDLIDAVDGNRPPICDIQEGATTVEMVCGVFESHRRDGQAVEIPLAERGNALTKLSTEN
ncbi:Gfo/Idh/MocA family protein [Blastopirellula marina]|uniref:3-chlorobenzoate-3,4-dioxygenase n=1 Tax=Blastopirellula marina TaxID=124 RepID=A0A2S8F715_9BACT|nr:Gfo/Idh/MocA family oxidoreductase [Blastopirellula marina]PQO27734.1 3-chlorobenzoate-3,4-dioxygenase [Blastopirellula marina]PTL41473.1 gfo/Idh/MocA family oxidoreductase [Blastopirellula marina]